MSLFWPKRQGVNSIVSVRLLRELDSHIRLFFQHFAAVLWLPGWQGGCTTEWVRLLEGYREGRICKGYGGCHFCFRDKRGRSGVDPTEGPSPENLSSLDLALAYTRNNFVLPHLASLLVSSSCAIAAS